MITPRTLRRDEILGVRWTSIYLANSRGVGESFPALEFATRPGGPENLRILIDDYATDDAFDAWLYTPPDLGVA